MLDRFPTFFLFFKNFDILLLSWWWSFWWDLVSKIKEFLPPLEPNLLTNKYSELGGSPGLVVMGDDSCSRSSGFESLRRTLDGHDIFSHWSVVKIVLFLKRPKTNEKDARVGPIKKTNIQSSKLPANVSTDERPSFHPRMVNYWKVMGSNPTWNSNFITDWIVKRTK